MRNRQKVAATVGNARAYLELKREMGSFDEYLWSFVGGRPIMNAYRTMSELPAQSPESEAMSRDLMRRGFRFVGPTICYAFMQAVGMIHDHLVDCFRYGKLKP